MCASAADCDDDFHPPQLHSEPEVVVTDLAGNHVMRLFLNASETVGEVKRLVSAACGVPRFAQQLTLGTQVLDDDKLPLCGLQPCRGELQLSLVRLPVDHESGRLLHALAVADEPCSVEELLRSAADPNALNRDRLPLHVAAKHGRLKVTELLLEAAACPSAEDSDFGVTPLHCACVGGHEEVVQLLCKSRADVNAADGVGATPLVTAARFGHSAVVRVLCGAGAALDAADAEGCTATSLAASLGHKGVTVELKQQAAARAVHAHVHH
eukprot:gnl/TRDRNA2_/TRDRNA2_197033_c0_seq1.p1 gnl/TRDRNA2_/TRDRNA2_197033_c0~~gnl/TRDRNA2_/TRDRNA2_197033_c0_seq1.p1  ORF type:complete len:268 (-),score=61.06 gnl/TRDRNA2_/TRDRNA2_197033_c0_seq1:27-830(-)